MEILLEDILVKLNNLNFSEPKQITDEINRLILKDKLPPKDVSYISSKIFNSEFNFFTFLNKNCLSKEKRLVNMRKDIFNIIKDYITINSSALNNYLVMIRDFSLVIFKKDVSQIVKERALAPIQTIIEIYDGELLETTIQVKETASILLDEIKILRPKAGVKGMIWTILGLLTDKFSTIMLEFRVEIEELILFNMTKIMKSNKGVEIKTLEGVFRGLRFLLNGSTNYTDKEMEDIYLNTVTGIEIIEDVKNYKIVKQALMILEFHIEKFEKYLWRNEIDLIDSLLNLVAQKNKGVKEFASRAFEALMELLAKRGVSDHHKNLVTDLMNKIKKIVKKSPDPIEVMMCIRCFGILSKTIVNCLAKKNYKRISTY